MSRSIEEIVIVPALRLSLYLKAVNEPISDVEPDGGRSWEAWGDEWSKLGQQQGSAGLAG